MPDPIPEANPLPEANAQAEANVQPEASPQPGANAQPGASPQPEANAQPQANAQPEVSPLAKASPLAEANPPEASSKLDPSPASPANAPPEATASLVAPASPEDVARALKALWPALFAGAPKPLKLRIQIDIQERQPGRFSKQALSAFFRRHTGSTSYLHAVAHGRARFDLDGQPSGEISDEHRQIAREELARRRGNQDARRELEDQQRRNRAGLLHDYERTTLTRANFCVLRQVDEAELDGLLALAREEAAAARRAAPPVRPGPPSGPRGPSRGGPPPRGKPTGA